MLFGGVNFSREKEAVNKLRCLQNLGGKIFRLVKRRGNIKQFRVRVSRTFDAIQSHFFSRLIHLG